MRVAFMKGVSLYCFRIFSSLGFKKGVRTSFRFFAPLFCKKISSNIVFKFSKLGHFRRFLWILNTVTKYANIGYYFDLRLKGLGFKAKRSRYVKKSKIWKLWLGHSGFKFIMKSRTKSMLIVKKLGKFQLFFFSPSKMYLQDLFAHLILFRVVRPYKKVKGLINTRQLFIMRPSRKVR